MRKTLLLTALAAITLTASAQDLESNDDLRVTKGNLTATDATVSVTATPRLTDVDLANPVGTYLCKTVSTINENVSHEITIAQTDDGAYTVTGLMAGSTKALNATYANGTLTIPAGQVSYSTSSYGDASLYVMIDDTHYNTTIDPTFTLDESGKFTLSNGVGLVQLLSGSYEGSNLNDVYVGGYDFIPVNGTMTNTRVTYTGAYQDVTTFDTAVEYGDGKGVVRGIEGLSWVTFTYNDSSAVTFAQDSLYYYNDLYGLAVMTMGEITSTSYVVHKGVCPTGVIDFEAGTITLNPWCLVLDDLVNVGFTTIYKGRKSQSVITFPAVESSAISDVAVESTTEGKVRKYISDGQLIIEKDGVKYNIAGQTIK